MHLAENYALTAGAKISQPFIEPAFYPVPAEKYITFHNGSGMLSKNYEYFNNVFDLINPFLSKNNIKVVQIGSGKEPKIKGCIDLIDKTSIRQCAFVLKNSMLHIGNDSFSAHISAFFETPIVCLYGPVLVDTCRPYWGDKSKQVLMSPDYSTRKPSFTSNEVEKRINEIFPNEVAGKCLDLLNIEHSFDSHKPIHLGPSFNTKVIDIIPDFKPNNNIVIQKNSLLNLRLDYTDNPNWIKYWLSRYKCSIISDKKLNLSILSEFKSNISKILLTVNTNTSIEYIQSILSTGIKLKLFANPSDDLSKIRLNLFPNNVFPEDYLDKKDLDNPSILCDNTCYYESSISLIKDNKIYPCKAALDAGIEKQDKQLILDNETFYQEIDYFKIYKYDKD